MNLRIFISIIAAVMLCSCFTGIESTPRITAKDVRNEVTEVSPEQTFMSAVIPEAPSNWSIGKQWLVTDDKIALIFTPGAERIDSLAGEIIEFAGTRSISTVTGEDAVELSFTRPCGQKLSYITSITPTEMAKRESLSIPFTIELSPVAIADSIMRGRSYFITTSRWHDATGNVEQGLRHVAVTIDSVVPGKEHQPLKVAFHLNSDPKPHYVMMTYGNGATATRNFDKFFSFTDPRLQYKHIEDATWQLIINSQVATGMTRDECRLALGIPNAIARGASQAAHIERWSYDDGIYLIFEDGILTRFRK